MIHTWQSDVSYHDQLDGILDCHLETLYWMTYWERDAKLTAEMREVAHHIDWLFQNEMRMAQRDGRRQAPAHPGTRS